MKALTLWQPWASSIVYGPKRIENRPWKPPEDLMGERFLIHAGLKWDDSAVALLAAHWPQFREAEDLGIKFPTGAIIGSVRLVGCLSKPQPGDSLAFNYSGALCFGRIDTLKRRTDPLFFGPFGWVLEDVEAFDKPIECRGFQKLWNPKPDVLAQVPR